MNLEKSNKILTIIVLKKKIKIKRHRMVGTLNRKSQLALIGILLAALLGAYASSMTLVGSIQLSDLTMRSFTISADKLTISGGPPSMKMTISAIGVDGIRNVVIVESAVVEIENMTLIKVEGEKTLKIEATSAVGSGVDMTVTNLVAEEANFTDLTMTDIPVFVQSADGKVTLTGVEITAYYMFAETMTMWGMELTVS